MELIQGGESGFSVIRAFRLVRLVKLIRFLPSLQRQMLIMMKTIDNVASFFLLVSLFLFIFAIMGMSLFGCQYCPALNVYMRPETKATYLNDSEIFKIELQKEINEGEESHEEDEEAHRHNLYLIRYFICPRSNFDTLSSSLFTVLQVFTQDSWTTVLKDGMSVTSDWAGLYFVALVSIGNYILLNLLVAILVEGFSSDEIDKEQAEIQGENLSKYKISQSNSNQSNFVPAPLASMEVSCSFKIAILSKTVKRTLTQFYTKAQS